MEGIITKQDKKYPELLKKAGDAPKQLYYKGNWDASLFERCLAVVGTRRMTSYGRRIVEQFVGEIASRGITIVSGFMYGIDATAHGAALRAGGKTIAVMPCGIDVVHPEYQADLYKDIIGSGGLIISEYEGTHPVAQWTFPRRNRIVAGLSQAILVIEAGEGSGALITADFAKKYGRKVFAVPGSLLSPVSFGVTQLLKTGAEVAGSAQDILDFFGLRKRTQKSGLHQVLLQIEGELEQKIVQQLQKEPMQIDEISRALVLPASKVGAVLSLLELGGYIMEEQGKYYVV